MGHTFLFIDAGAELAKFLELDLSEGLGAVFQVEYGSEGAVGFVLDDLLDCFDGIWRGFWQVDAGDLKRVEEQAGAFGIEGLAGDALRDKADGRLDRGAVFEGGQLEVGVGFVDDFGLAGCVVVVAEGFAAQAFAAAAVSVGEDVAALEVFGLWLWHDETPTPGKVCKVRTDKELSLDLVSPDGREHRSVGSSSDLTLTLI